MAVKTAGHNECILQSILICVSSKDKPYKPCSIFVRSNDISFTPLLHISEF